MTIREAIKQQQESIKNRSFRQRLSFFWTYYGVKTICLLLALITVVAFIVSIATQKEYGFTGVFFGAEPQAAAERYLSDFAETARIDQDKFRIHVQAYGDIQMGQQITQEIYQSMEVFTAMVASHSVDCFAANTELFLYYGYLGYAADLRTVLTAEDLTSLSPYLYYIDGKLIEEQENTDRELTYAYDNRPDPTHPELMADPIPVAVDLTVATEAFRESYRFADAVIGICTNSDHVDHAAAFLRYCLALSE